MIISFLIYKIFLNSIIIITINNMIIYYEPNGIIKIEFKENKELLLLDIPYGLTDLYFGRYFNKPIKPGILSSTITKIIFGQNYNQIILPGVLPLDLKFLQFDIGFTQMINIDILPEKLTHLIFKGGYHHLITHNTLPKNLLQLSFYFNKYELNEYMLPTSLTHLNLGYNYNCEFKKGVLPEKLVYLGLSEIYSHILKEVPPTLIILNIYGSKKNKPVLDNLPNMIEILILYKLEIPLEILPPSIKYIKLIYYSKLTLQYLNNLPLECKILDKTNKEIKK